jgi:hypothetical protein
VASASTTTATAPPSCVPPPPVGPQEPSDTEWAAATPAAAAGLSAAEVDSSSLSGIARKAWLPVSSTELPGRAAATAPEHQAEFHGSLHKLHIPRTSATAGVEAAAAGADCYSVLDRLTNTQMTMANPRDTFNREAHCWYVC